MPFALFGQIDSLNLLECFDLSENSHPLYKQKQLNDQITEARSSNLSKLWLPSLSVEGQATYQSDVVEVDFGNFLPQQIPAFSATHDQYKIYMSLEQKIFDGGIIKQQKALENSTYLVNQQQLEVNFHQTKQQVAAVFFSIVSLTENIKLFEVLKNDLTERYKSIEVAVENGSVLLSNALVLKAEILKIEQQISELQNRKMAQAEILSMLTGMDIKDQTVFEWPGEIITDTTGSRPEIVLLDLQKELANSGLSVEKSLNKPKVFAFSQAGYGKPGLNMLNTEFDTYYIIGVGLKWKFYDWGELKNKKRIAEYQKNTIDLKKDDLNRNISIALQNELANIENYNDAIRRDEEIISMRKEIVKSALVQFENGTITANQYLTESNAELQAKIQLETHKILLAQSQINYMLIKGDI